MSFVWVILQLTEWFIVRMTYFLLELFCILCTIIFPPKQACCHAWKRFTLWFTRCKCLQLFLQYCNHTNVQSYVSFSLLMSGIYMFHRSLDYMVHTQVRNKSLTHIVPTEVRNRSLSYVVHTVVRNKSVTYVVQTLARHRSLT